MTEAHWSVKGQFQKRKEKEGKEKNRFVVYSVRTMQCEELLKKHQGTALHQVSSKSIGFTFCYSALWDIQEARTMAPKGAKRGGRGGGANKGKKTVAKASGESRGRAKAPKGGQGGNRNRSKSKGPGGKKGGRGNPRRNSAGRGKGPKKQKEEKKKLTAEELDSAMDDYWLKSDNKEVAAKKLDEEMDAYWEKKGEAKEEETTDAAAEATGETTEAAETS